MKEQFDRLRGQTFGFDTSSFEYKGKQFGTQNKHW